MVFISSRHYIQLPHYLLSRNMLWLWGLDCEETEGVETKIHVVLCDSFILATLPRLQFGHEDNCCVDPTFPGWGSKLLHTGLTGYADQSMLWFERVDNQKLFPSIPPWVETVRIFAAEGDCWDVRLPRTLYAVDCTQKNTQDLLLSWPFQDFLNNITISFLLSLTIIPLLLPLYYFAFLFFFFYLSFLSGNIFPCISWNVWLLLFFFTK